MKQFYELVIFDAKYNDEYKFYFQNLDNAKKFACKKIRLTNVLWKEMNFHGCNESYTYKDYSFLYEIHCRSFED